MLDSLVCSVVAVERVIESARRTVSKGGMDMQSGKAFHIPIIVSSRLVCKTVSIRKT